MHVHSTCIPSFMSIKKQLLKAQQYLLIGNYDKAIEKLNKYLKANPTDISGLMIRGEAYLRGEQFELALEDYAKIVQLDPKNILALNNFSIALMRCNKYKEAKEIIAYVHELDPSNFPAYINLGHIHQALGEYKEAINSAMCAVQQDPKSSLAYLNLGSALGGIRLLQEAKQAFLLAEFYDSKNIYTKINLAQIEEKLGNFKDAKLIYEEILTLDYITPSEYNIVNYYLSYIYLSFGEIKKGWELYEYGFSGLLPSSAVRSLRKFNQPKWNGNFTETRTILIWREQGLGDEILFSSCLNDIHDLDLNIIFECDPRLVNIFQRTYPKFKVRSELIQNDYYSPHNDFELNIALGSLPKYFRNNITDFDRHSTNWKPLPEYSNFISEKLQPYRNKILIGICWRSSLLSVERNLNYTALKDWEVLLCNTSYQFVNLFHGDCEKEIFEIEKLFGINILRWNDIDLKNDLETVLALVAQLDCVATVGTAVCTIAAAAGTPTLLLAQRSWDFLGQENSYPWFESVIPFVVETNQHVGLNIKKLPQFIKKRRS